MFALCLKVVGRVKGSLGIAGVNSDDRIAPTMTSSPGSCWNLSLTSRKAGSAKYTKKWYHGNGSGDDF